MASDTRDMLVKIKGDTSDFEKSMGKVKGQSDGAGLSFGKLTGAVALGNVIATGAEKAFSFLSDQIRSTIQSASESEKATSQLNAVLKSTGSAAGLTSKQLQDQATALQRMTTFSDEAVMSAQSLLLTFTNVKGQVFKDSVPLILDMSQALGQDLKSSSIQLGKALNDPIKGITALSRVGVSFTEQQKTMIKSLVDTGQTAKAQQVILAELRKEFGGSAEAAGKTFAGSLERLKNQIDDVKEKIGGAIIQGITPFTQKLAEFVSSDKFQAWSDKTAEFIVKLNQKFIEFLKGIYPTLKEAWKEIASTMRDWVIPAFQFLKDEMQKFIDKYPKLAEIIGIIAAIGIAFAINPVVTIIAGLIAALVLLHEHWGRIKQIATDTWTTIKKIIDPFIPLFIFLGGIINANVIQPMIGLWQVIATQLWPALKSLWDTISPALIPILQFLGVVVGGILVAAFIALNVVIGIIIEVIKGVVNIVAFMVNSVTFWIDVFTGNWKKIPQDLKNILGNVGSIITAPFKDAFDWIKNNVGAVVDSLKRLDPFKKHSPSLVELVTAGTKEIKNQYGAMYGDLKKMGSDMSAPDMVQPIAVAAGASGTIQAPQQPISITLAPNIGMYAGMPAERREIAVTLWQDLMKMARAQGVQLPNINVAGIQ